MSVGLGIQHEMRMRHIVICCQTDSTIFFHLVAKKAGFSNKFTECKMCVLVCSTRFVWNISHSQKKWARYDQKCI